jgi:hypothetical protein
MALVIKAQELISRATRKRVTGGNLRKLDLKGAITQQKSSGGLVSFLFNAAEKLAGFISKAINFFQWSISGAVGWIINAATTLSQFNWNISDKELKTQLDSTNQQLASVWGGLTGSGIGWTVAIGLGFGVGLVVPVIGGSLLGASIATAVGREALGDLGQRLKNALVTSVNVAAVNATVNSYIGFRKMLKNPSNPVLGWIMGEERAKSFKKEWGREGGPDWSIAGQVEKKVESIPNKLTQEFVRSAISEGFEAFIEGGYVIAYELENAYQAAKLANQNQLGTDRAIRLEPDNRIEEPIVLSGPQELIKPAVQTALVQSRLIHNRDVGQILAQPYLEAVRATPQLRRLTIRFYSKPKPPWREKSGVKCKQCDYTIPDVKPGLTWEQVKRAASKFTWGKHKAIAQLNNQRQMVVYGNTPAEAERKLKELLTLSTAEILRLIISEEEITPLKLKKEPREMYPAYASLLFRRQSTDAHGRTMLDGKTLDEKAITITLWPQQEPKNTKRLP